MYDLVLDSTYFKEEGKGDLTHIVDNVSLEDAMASREEDQKNRGFDAEYNYMYLLYEYTGERSPYGHDETELVEWPLWCNLVTDPEEKDATQTL